jgi:hypothetical protein
VFFLKSNYRMNDMRIILFIVLLGVFVQIKAQVYLHPTTGIALENVGSCLTTTCGGTYYDNGGAAGNYTNNINGTYRVFCPNQAGQCLTATFSQFSIEGGAGCPYDVFLVLNGSTQNSPVIWGGCGAGAIGPFTGTTNGCLGFRFWSDFSVPGAGWAATFSCAPCPGAPSGTSNNDCNFATFLCSNATVPGNSTGPGIVSEACTGSGCPAGGENYSNWYIVQFMTGGTFTFSINPATATDDYDYAIYGPNVGCNALGPPLRCSDSGLTGATGLSAAAVDFSENVLGDKWTAQMNVLAGQTYYIMVDEWTPTGAGYSLTFGGTAVMSCSMVPVELASFEAWYDYEKRQTELSWLTLGELNCDYFEVQRSTDNETFETIDVISGNGTTNLAQRYFSSDASPFPGEVNYYRLKQVDYNGNFEYSWVQAVAIHDPEAQLQIIPQPAGSLAELRWITANEGTYRLDIYDCTARRFVRSSISVDKGMNRIPIDLSALTRGVYFLTIQGNGDFYSRTFVRE